MLKVKHTRTWLRRERLVGLHLKKALRQRYQKTFYQPKREIRRLSRRAASSLISHNSFSRRWWFRTLGGHLCRCLRARPPHFRPAKPIYFLTLIDRGQVVDPDNDTFYRRPNPTITEVRSAYSQHLRGLDCLGMIDAALYVSMRRYNHLDRVIVYHCHLLVWNVSAEALNQRCRAIRQEIRSFVPNTTSAHVVRVNPNDRLQMIWYMTKAPRSQHQLHRRETRRWFQYKRPINGVNSVRLYAAMRSLQLEELTLAQGQGVELLAQTLTEMRGKFI